MENNDIMLKIDALEEKRLSAYNENCKIRKQIEELDKKSKELYKEEFEYKEKISKLKSDGTSQYLGKYLFIKGVYIYVTSIANEYNSCLCAFSGPRFSLHPAYKHGNILNISSSLDSAHSNAQAYAYLPEDIQIISKEEYFKAFDELVDNIKKQIEENISKKPIKIKDNEFLYENSLFECNDGFIEK